MKLQKTPVFLFILFAGCCLLSCKSTPGTLQEPVAQTTAGTVSGSIDDSIYAFLGIPYARAERFMPPQDPEAWEGILECTAFSPVARQIVPWYPDSVQDEKKMFTVNVWTQ